jgi:hypothetical protein
MPIGPSILSTAPAAGPFAPFVLGAGGLATLLPFLFGGGPPPPDIGPFQPTYGPGGEPIPTDPRSGLTQQRIDDLFAVQHTPEGLPQPFQRGGEWFVEIGGQEFPYLHTETGLPWWQVTAFAEAGGVDPGTGLLTEAFRNWLNFLPDMGAVSAIFNQAGERHVGLDDQGRPVFTATVTEPIPPTPEEPLPPRDVPPREAPIPRRVPSGPGGTFNFENPFPPAARTPPPPLPPPSELASFETTVPLPPDPPFPQFEVPFLPQPPIPPPSGPPNVFGGILNFPPELPPEVTFTGWFPPFTSNPPPPPPPPPPPKPPRDVPGRQAPDIGGILSSIAALAGTGQQPVDIPPGFPVVGAGPVSTQFPLPPMGARTTPLSLGEILGGFR